MSKIVYLKYNDAETISLLSTAFAENSLIPIIGAGFTRGCVTRSRSRVPSGDEFKEIMISIIKEQREYTDGLIIDKLKKKKFSEVSDLFFNED